MQFPLNANCLFSIKCYPYLCIYIHWLLDGVGSLFSPLQCCINMHLYIENSNVSPNFEHTRASLPLNSTPLTILLRHEAIYWLTNMRHEAIYWCTNMHLFITGVWMWLGRHSIFFLPRQWCKYGPVHWKIQCLLSNLKHTSLFVTKFYTSHHIIVVRVNLLTYQ